MTLSQSVCDVLRDHVVLESECIDRMYLNVYVPQLQRVGGVVCGTCAAISVSALPRPRRWRPRRSLSWQASRSLSPRKVSIW